VARRLLVWMAFATWCFVNTWVALGNPDVPHFARHNPLLTVALPVLAWEAVLTAILFAAGEFLRRRGASALEARLFVAACVWPLGMAAVSSLELSPVNLAPLVRKPWFWPAALTLAAGPGAWAMRNPYAAARLLRGILLYSWPALASIVAQGARVSLTYPPAAFADGTLLPRLSTPPRPLRVVWILFDELSETVVFEHRPAGMRLPEFDRLRNESLYATQAYSPGNFTSVALPSLLLGRHVTAAIPQGPRCTRIQFGTNLADWAHLPNVFDDARRLGFNTALVGWYYPYGRLLNHSLVECYWTAGWLGPGAAEWSQPLPLSQAMGKRAALQWSVLPLAGHLPGMSPGIHQRQEKARHYRDLLQRGRMIAADPTIGLALIHLEVPHPPAISHGCRIAPGDPVPGSYLDSVVLADCILGELRRGMEQAGVWDRTAIIVSADHGWRTNIWRGSPDWTPGEEVFSALDTSGVPFLVKLPGQTSASCWDRPFDTIVTRAVIGKILAGELHVITGMEGAIAHAGEAGAEY
jgi:hypothetical protein